MAAIERWLRQKYVKPGESLRDIYPALHALNGQTSAHGFESNMRKAIIACFEMLTTSGMDADGHMVILRRIDSQISDVFRRYFGFDVGMERLKVLERLVFELLPMQEVMLARAENRMIDIQTT